MYYDLCLKNMSANLFIFQQKKALKKYLKCFLIHLKSSFRSQDTQFLVILLLLFQLFPFKVKVKKWNNMMS